MRECSRVAAITYEEFTGDWAGATFSSSKMGVATNWPRILYRRRNIVAPLAQYLYEAFLEEDIEIGGTPFPGGVEGLSRQPRGGVPGVLARPVDAAGR
jgi:capsid protein